MRSCIQKQLDGAQQNGTECRGLETRFRSQTIFNLTQTYKHIARGRELKITQDVTQWEKLSVLYGCIEGKIRVESKNSNFPKGFYYANCQKKLN